MNFLLILFFILINQFSLNYSKQHNKPQFYSQVGQDSYVMEHFFPHKKDGFFCEIGAFDGIKFSNTYVFERLGWKGICVEPIPERFDQLKKNRNCICVKGCITDHEGTLLFRQVGESGEMSSGLVEKYDPLHIQRIEAAHCSAKYFQVHCYTLSSLMKKYDIQKIDFLSIDTEGGELDILQSLSDEELACIDVIAVEDNYKDPKLVQFFTEKGFKIIVRLEMDIICRNTLYM